MDSYVDDITWVKQTVNRRMAKGHGYYLQHAKETCLVGKKVIICGANNSLETTLIHDFTTFQPTEFVLHFILTFLFVGRGPAKLQTLDRIRRDLLRTSWTESKT